MIKWFENSLIFRAVLWLIATYKKSALYAFFEFVKSSYKTSSFSIWYEKFTNDDIAPKTSLYVRFTIKITKLVHKLGDILQQSVIYKFFSTICNVFLRFFEGSFLARMFSKVGFRGLLLIAFAAYLPIDYFLRSVLQIGFLASGWDEGFMILVLCYVTYRKSILQEKLPQKTTTPGTFILAFIGVTFFLMCFVAEYPSIAFDGWRAVVQYIFWFFLVIRLIENDKDFKIFYTTLMVVAIAIAFHGIYQFIVAVPIPSGWTSAAESDVRTRVFSLTGSPNIMGSFLVLFAPLVAAIAYYSKKIPVKICAIGLTGIMCLSIIFTYSRGALVGLAVAVLIFAIYLDRRLIALMFAGASSVLIFVPSIRERFAFLFTPEYVEASMRDGRMIRWVKGLDLLHDSNPLLGFGLGRFGGAVAMQNQVIEETSTFQYFYMDNYYLKTLVETGYLGLTFYIIMLIGIVVWCMRAIGRTRTSTVNPLVVGMFSGMCGVLAHCYYENIFEVPYMVAYFWALAAGVYYLGYFRRSSV